MIGITGARGVIGAILQSKLRQAGLAFSAFSGNVLKSEELRSWISGCNPECLIHLAAKVPVADVDSDPLTAYEVNVTGTLNLLKVLQERKEQCWLFYAGSSHVYAPSEKPISEDYPRIPCNIYGRTKLAGENVCIDFGSSCRHVTVCVGRIFSFYHESQTGTFLYPSLKRRLVGVKPGDDFELFGADSLRDFLNAEAVADIIIKMMKHRAEGIYNIASGKPVKIRDFVAEVAGFNLNIIPRGSNNCLVADITKLENLLKDDI